MTKNLPRDVTLISKRALGTASVIRLTSDGRRYYHGESLHRVDGQIEAGSSWQYEKANYLLIEGQRWDLVEKVRKSLAEYRTARKQHDHDRERAKWRLLDEWDEVHPSPSLPKVEEIIKEEKNEI